MGFCCEIIRSLCYDAPYAKITELFVMDPPENRGLNMLLQVGSCCRQGNSKLPSVYKPRN